jgi:hypothetical protein
MSFHLNPILIKNLEKKIVLSMIFLDKLHAIIASEAPVAKNYSIGSTVMQ